MKKFAVLTLSFFLIGLVGCSKSPVDVQENDEAVIAQMLSDSTDLVYDALNDETDDAIQDDSPNWLARSTVATTSWVRFHFGRIATKKEKRNIEVVMDSDTTATAYIYIKIEGKFKIFKAEGIAPDSALVTKVEKPMVHELERIVHLRKVRNTDDPRKNWRIKDVSMRNGHSPDNTVEIVELRIKADGQDEVVITDPLEYLQTGVNLFTFPRFTDVTLEVKVKNTSPNKIVYPKNTEATEFVRLHYGRNIRGNHGRSYFKWVRKDGEYNVYEGSWKVMQFRGIHMAVIDVVDNGTVLEKDAQEYPYNSSTWDTRYRVTKF